MSTRSTNRLLLASPSSAALLSLAACGGGGNASGWLISRDGSSVGVQRQRDESRLAGAACQQLLALREDHRHAGSKPALNEAGPRPPCARRAQRPLFNPTRRS
jgi:hypothetical protein